MQIITSGYFPLIDHQALLANANANANTNLRSRSFT